MSVLQAFDVIDERSLHAEVFGSHFMACFTQYLIHKDSVTRLLTVTLRVCAVVLVCCRPGRTTCAGRLQGGHFDDVVDLVDLYYETHPDSLPRTVHSADQFGRLRAYMDTHGDMDRSLLSHLPPQLH